MRYTCKGLEKLYVHLNVKTIISPIFLMWVRVSKNDEIHQNCEILKLCVV